MKKVLLVHLNSNGDCLFATIIARQIKEVDYPNCHLTWAVNSKCKQSVYLNPYVDDIWEIPTEKTATTSEEWNFFVEQFEDKKRNDEFDFVFITQIIAENWFNYDGGIRSSTYNNYPHKITVPHQPIIRLSDAETASVKRFAEKHQLDKFKRIVLVECGPDSFDVALNQQAAYELASDANYNETAFILSSNKPISSSRPNIIDGSELTFRENAELTKYCDLFVGCASGISWLATTDWAKKLNMVLVINQDNAVFPSMIYDHEYLNLPTDHIIEIRNDDHSMRNLKKCLDKIFSEGFDQAKKTFNQKVVSSNYEYVAHQLAAALVGLNFVEFFSRLLKNLKRNGTRIIFTSQFIKIIRDLQYILRNKLRNKLRLKPNKVLINK